MLRESSRKGEKAQEAGTACRAIWYSQWPGIADFHVLALRLSPCARSFDAAGKLTQRRRSAKKQVGLAEPSRYSQWAGIADFHVLALRLCALARGPLMLRERSRKGAKAQEAGVACRAIPVFAVAGIADGWVLALRLCALREVLRCCGKAHAKAEAQRSRYGLPRHLGIRSGLV